jgi:hypothetical protein
MLHHSLAHLISNMQFSRASEERGASNPAEGKGEKEKYALEDSHPIGSSLITESRKVVGRKSV